MVQSDEAPSEDSGVSRRSFLVRAGAVAGLTWSAPIMSSVDVSPKAGSPPPTSTTPSPPGPISVTGTAAGVSDVGGLSCTSPGFPVMSSGTFDLTYLGAGRYSYSYCTDNVLPSFGLHGTFEFSPSSGGLVRGSVEGTQTLAGLGLQSSLTFTVEEGVGPFQGLTGSLHWEGTHLLTTSGHTDDREVITGTLLPQA
jgi:hypothetical protein